jgi:hypothetical protein
MKITKSQLKKLIKEELNEMLGGGNYPGARGSIHTSTLMTIADVEGAFQEAGVKGLFYGQAKDVIEHYDKRNLDIRHLRDVLSKLPRHALTTGRPYSALEYVFANS